MMGRVTRAFDPVSAAVVPVAVPTPISVLQIEDEPDDAELVLIELRRSGFLPTATCVRSPQELRSALARSWDVIISDYHMGTFEAPDALAIVREHDPDVPFLIVSGSIGEESAVAAMRAGAQDFFLKDSLHRLGVAVSRESERARSLRSRRLAVAELSDARARLQALFDQAIVGIAQLDPDGRFVVASHTFCDLVGRSVPELLMQQDVDVVAPEDAGAYAACVQRMRKDQKACAVEVRYVKPSGQVVWVNASVSPLRDPDGAVIGTVVVAHDVTERRRSEAERETLVSELAQAVKFSETFAGVLGHDLRNPLATITMAAQMLARKPESIESSTNVLRIGRSAERMRDMIDQLLDLTRIRVAGGIPIECAACDLATIAHQAVDELVNASSNADLRLEVRGNTEGTWDRHRLLQLVSNLAANALAHGDSTRTIRVLVDGTNPARVCLSVENGGHIPEAMLENVFEPLHASTTSRRQGGLGLGLFIVRHIARAHGGDAVVTSTPASGTCFEVVLPRTSS